ncbi:MAG: hypothetical protein DRI61_05580 [Chloroflexi bacterium]|nr:MAG: hypothetical protein DRI61_05580 [Chloroflexota bacterium]
MNVKRIAIALVSLLLLSVLLTPAAYAFDFRSGGRVIIGEGEVIEDDLYIAADEVVIDGIVKGDLLATAEKIVVNGSVEGDLFGMAREIIINGSVGGDVWGMGQKILVRGDVGDDLRAAGMVITLEKGGSVGDALLAGCYALDLRSGSNIGGEVRWGSGLALLAGEIGKDVVGEASNVEISGHIRGNVKVKLSEEEGGGPPPEFFPFAGGVSIPSVPEGLHITDEARIEGSLTYVSAEEADISPAAQIAGGISRKEPERPKAKKPAKPAIGSPRWFLGRLQYFVSLLVVGFLLAWVAPRQIERMEERLKTKPLPSFGWGIVIAISVPVAGLIFAALVIFIGIAVSIALGKLGVATLACGLILDGALFTLFFVSVAYVSKVIVSLWAGRTILAKIWPSQAQAFFGPIAAGTFAFVVLNSIPYFGILVWLLTVIPGLGAMLALRK